MNFVYSLKQLIYVCGFVLFVFVTKDNHVWSAGTKAPRKYPNYGRISTTTELPIQELKLTEIHDFRALIEFIEMMSQKQLKQQEKLNDILINLVVKEWNEARTRLRNELKDELTRQIESLRMDLPIKKNRYDVGARGYGASFESCDCSTKYEELLPTPSANYYTTHPTIKRAEECDLSLWINCSTPYTDTTSGKTKVFASPLREGRNRMEGERICREKDARFPTIKSSEENLFVANYVKMLIDKIGIRYYPWIGLTKTSSMFDEWKWDYDNSMAKDIYINWAPNFPKQGKNRNAAFIMSNGYWYNNEPNSKQLAGVICEYFV